MTLSRRRFLAVTSTTAALAACTSSKPPVPSPSSTSPPPPVVTRTTTVAPTPTSTPSGPQSVAALRTKLGARLVLPTDRAYASARLAYNPAFDSHKPAAVAQCATAADVQACVGVAAATKMPIAARSGGHSYVGYSTPSAGLVVDLTAMKTVQVRPDGTAVIGAGARLIDVYSALAGAGRCLPGGSCPTVGIAGLTLGGGIGFLARKYGLTCDRLVSAQVVTADGQVRTASATSEPELFFALRGGGGGNLGIVTSFTFQTAPAPAPITFGLEFGSGAVPGVFGAWQHWIATMPLELFANCNINAKTSPSCSIAGCFVGNPTALSPLLDALVRASGETPSNRYQQPKGYLDAMRGFAGCSNLSTSACEPSWTAAGGQLDRETFHASSRVIQKVTDPQKFVDAVAGSGVAAIVDGLGGQVAALKPTDTAFPHRTALASVQIYHSGADVNAVNGVRDRLGALLGPSGYVNYLDAAMPSWGTAYYGANLPRLKAAAAMYDPNHVFAFAQGLALA